MQLSKRGAALLAGLAGLAVLAVGCTSKGTNNSGGGGGGGTALNGTDAVATVNGDPITQAQFYEALQMYTPSPQMQGNAQQAGHAVLATLISNRIICLFAKQEQVAPTPAQIDSEFSSLKWSAEGHYPKTFEAVLEDEGTTPESYKANQLTPRLCRQNLLTKGLTVTDAEIKAYYELNKAKQYTRPERAHIKRIIVASKADADQISSQIKAGKPFDQLLSRSMATLPADGDLNELIPLDDSGGTGLKPLVDAIKKTDVNGVTEPVTFQGNFWIMKVVEKRPKEEGTLDNVKNQITAALLNQKAQQNPAGMQGLQSKAQDFTMNANIVIPQPQYADIIAALKKPPPAPPAPMAAPPPMQMKPGAPGKKPTITISPSKPK